MFSHSFKQSSCCNWINTCVTSPAATTREGLRSHVSPQHCTFYLLMVSKWIHSIPFSLSMDILTRRKSEFPSASWAAACNQLLLMLQTIHILKHSMLEHSSHGCVLLHNQRHAGQPLDGPPLGLRGSRSSGTLRFFVLLIDSSTMVSNVIKN